MARVLLFSFFVSFTALSIAQNFHEKYEISEFINGTDFTIKRKAFRVFKNHLEKRNYKFDSGFRKEYKEELQGHPLALHIFKKYKRKSVSAYVINVTSALLVGAALSIFDHFLVGFITGLIGTQLYTFPFHISAKVNFIESLLIYDSEINDPTNTNSLKKKNI